MFHNMENVRTADKEHIMQIQHTDKSSHNICHKLLDNLIDDFTSFSAN